MEKIKLHLGCGQRYFEGYINVDFPSTEHSFQKRSVADKKADIRNLSYPPETVEEIRLHHLFEHFSRPVACALLVAWRMWLKPKGKLLIEVPDFTRTALLALNPFVSFRSKAVAKRHIFGSNEADWAVHLEGWSSGQLKKLLKKMGFKILKVEHNSWKKTYNFKILAEKNNENYSLSQLEDEVKSYLSNFLVDASENDLLDIWMDMYKKQLNKSGIK